MKKILLIVICCLLLFTGCSFKSGNANNSTTQKSDIKVSDEKMLDIKVIINDKTYTLKLENNNTAKEFINLLP